MPASEDRIEAEWQFDVHDLDPIEKWLADPPESVPLALSIGPRFEHIDTYLDTPGWRIYHAGYALRLRQRQERSEVTLKSLDPREGGFSARRELTQQLDGDGEAAIKQLDGPVGERVRAICGRESTYPLFTLVTQRQTYRLSSENSEIGELGLDTTTFIGDAFADQSQLLRVEVESNDGEPARLQPFIEMMIADCRLEPATGSKFETGLRLHALTPIEPGFSEGLTFDQRSTIDAVARAILRRQLSELLRREPGTRLGDDEEELHDMRVAARRLRAALSLFASHLPDEFGAMRDELRWAAAALGEVRDLDVQLSEIRDWAARIDPVDGEALDPLLAELQQRRSAARERMLEVLDSERYEQFIARFSELLAPSEERAPAAPAVAVAPELVQRRLRKFRARADRIKPSSSDKKFHAVRIEGKRLRYALEFLSPLYGKGVTEYIRALVQVQDLIGKHQDAIVAIAHLRELSNAEPARLPDPTIFAMGRIAERYATVAQETRDGFPAAYRPLSGRRLDHLSREICREADTRTKQAGHKPKRA